MSTIQLNVVTISKDEAPTPEHIQVSPGDIVAFRAENTDAMLCFDKAAIFGSYQYIIPRGTTLPLVVQNDARFESTAYTVKTNLADDRECFPRSDKGGTIRIAEAGQAAGGRGRGRSTSTRQSVTEITFHFQEGNLPVLNVNRGDTVHFHAVEDHVVLCFPDATVFGDARIAISNGQTETRIVPQNAPEEPFDYRAEFGDLTAECRPDRGEDEGGSVGGGS